MRYKLYVNCIAEYPRKRNYECTLNTTDCIEFGNSQILTCSREVANCFFRICRCLRSGGTRSKIAVPGGIERRKPQLQLLRTALHAQPFSFETGPEKEIACTSIVQFPLTRLGLSFFSRAMLRFFQWSSSQTLPARSVAR